MVLEDISYNDVLFFEIPDVTYEGALFDISYEKQIVELIRRDFILNIFRKVR